MWFSWIPIRVIASLATNLCWQIFQADIKNAFLYEDHTKEVYMKQPLRHDAQGEN